MEKELLQQILSEVKSIQTDVSDLKVGQQKLETEMTGMKSEITNIKSDITDMKSEMVSMKSHLLSLRSQQEETLQIAKAIRHRQDVSDAKLHAITMDAHHMNGSITDLKEGQHRQDRVLESLSIHSFEQETKLREWKRMK